MKRLTAVAILITLATVVMSQETEPPEYAMYSSTSEQYVMTKNDFKPLPHSSLFNFRIGLDDTYAYVLWDYDGAGIQNEEVETYRHTIGDNATHWTDSDGEYSMWYSPKMERYMLYLNLYDDRFEYMVIMRRVGEWN